MKHEMKKILVTGAAGFIGFHLIQKLFESGNQIIGIDNLNDYYDVNLKIARLEKLKDMNTAHPDDKQNSRAIFKFEKIDLIERKKIHQLFENEKFDCVINLAAQAGVRHSIENPYAYIDSNIIGFMNILEACRNYPVKHLIYASSSSVYGANVKQPFSENDNVDHPVSLYAATKKSNELMAHTYSSLYGIPATGLRFFTVYGPWGRPDMAYFKFTKSIIEGKPIDVYNKGNLERDFTYIDDCIDGIIKTIKKLDTIKNNVINLSSGEGKTILEVAEITKKLMQSDSKIILKENRTGEVVKFIANIEKAKYLLNHNPKTNLEEGIKKSVQWFKTQ
jgi:UDP-glucuronate 4-epimerase